MLTGKSIALDVRPTYTVSCIKDIIFEKEGIPPIEQRLIFAGKDLITNRILAEYNIQKGSTIQLAIRLLSHYEPHIGERIFVRHEKAIISILFEDGIQMKDQGGMNVQLEKRIIDLKEKIESKINIPILSQELYFNGAELMNERTLVSYGLMANSRLDLVEIPPNSSIVPIVVNTPLETLLIDIDLNKSSTDISSILKAQNKEKNSQMDKLQLMFEGSLLEEGKSLKENNIKKNSIINAVNPYILQIFENKLKSQKEEIETMKKQHKTILNEIIEHNTQFIKRERESQKIEYCCPITLRIMKNPVVAADGRSYERAAIKKWFKKHSTSPTTNLPISKILYPNIQLKNLIEFYNDNKNI